MKCTKLKVFSRKYPKKSVLVKKIGQLYQNKYFKTQLIHFLMTSITNLFGLEQIEGNSSVSSPHSFWERLIRNLKSTC